MVACCKFAIVAPRRFCRRVRGAVRVGVFGTCVSSTTSITQHGRYPTWLDQREGPRNVPWEYRCGRLRQGTLRGPVGFLGGLGDDARGKCGNGPGDHRPDRFSNAIHNRFTLTSFFTSLPLFVIPWLDVFPPHSLWNVAFLSD